MTNDVREGRSGVEVTFMKIFSVNKTIYENDLK